MKRRPTYLFFLSMIIMSILSACTPFSQGGNISSKQPSQHTTTPPQLTSTALPSPPKLEITPNTGFNLDCSHINQKFDLYNSGGQSVLWVSQLYYVNGSKDPVQGITVNPADGNIISGGHFSVTMEGKTSAAFVVSFVYKESSSHAVGISQAVTCQ